MKKFHLSELTIMILVILVLIGSVFIIYFSQLIVEKTAFTTSPDVKTIKEQREIDKLAAEIKQIRSDTAGSLFWLKMIAVFVTVGGAVGGYLIGLSHTTRARIDFENRKNIDTIYQSIIQELSEDSPILRACAAVKIGAILDSFPAEWEVKESRRNQLIQQSKQVLAVSLAIESDPKILKTISIAIVLHRPWNVDPREKNKAVYGDLRNIDLSKAKASDAYWARVDFSHADFYRANLVESSLRESILCKSQFREAQLNKVVFAKADCESANFKLADLRDADFSEANLVKANFEGAKVFGTKLHGAKWGDNPDVDVDISPTGDGSNRIRFSEWIKKDMQTVS